MLCQYKDILGKPGQGVHKYRIFNIAIVDVLLTVLSAFIINHFFFSNFYIVLLVIFILGIIAHRVFCVKTTIDKLLFR